MRSELNSGSGYGNYVVVYHGVFDGKHTYSLYAHLQNEKVPNVGENVAVGQQIGLMGTSGGVPEHLHFEILQAAKRLTNTLENTRNGGATHIWGNEYRVNPDVASGVPIGIYPDPSPRDSVGNPVTYVVKDSLSPLRPLEPSYPVPQENALYGKYLSNFPRESVQAAPPVGPGNVKTVGGSPFDCSLTVPTPAPSDDSIAAVQASLAFRDKLTAKGIVGIGVGQELQDAFVRTMGGARGEVSVFGRAACCVIPSLSSGLGSGLGVGGEGRIEV